MTSVQFLDHHPLLIFLIKCSFYVQHSALYKSIHLIIVLGSCTSLFQIPYYIKCYCYTIMFLLPCSVKEVMLKLSIKRWRNKMPEDYMKYCSLNFFSSHFSCLICYYNIFLLLLTFLMFSCQAGEKKDSAKTIHIFTSRSVPQLMAMLEEFKKVLLIFVKI